MSHLALYRKYRPVTFDDVRGQESTVTYLQSIIQSGRIPHAILFTGSRGIGKTSLARIFARTVGINPNDIYEIDAASNNGVDNIRDLREEALTLPMSSPYKMYIFDEVHMFTSPAFNALLKILEEPPRHVLFVLATTELHKIPPTIISRCQVLSLKKPADTLIAEQVQYIATQEQKNILPEYAMMIAKRANGSFRDSLVILEQILEQSSNAEIIADDIDRVGLRMTDHLVYEFLDHLTHQKSDDLFLVVQQVVLYDNKTLIEFVEKIIEVMRSVLYITYAPSLWKVVRESMASDQVMVVQSCADKQIITPKLLAYFLHTYEEMKKTPLASIPLELAIITILSNTTHVNK